MKEVSHLSNKQKRSAVFLALVAVCVSFLLFTMVIPRTELTVNTTVHYSFSGISVGLQVRNSGTIEMTDMTMNITVIDEDGEVDYSEDVPIGNLPRGDRIVHSFTFTAPQVDKYDIILSFAFNCDGLDYNETVEHRMEDYLNFNWKDKIRDWRL